MEAKLTDRPILLVDCQSTGPNPKKGHLMELAWARLKNAVSQPQLGGGPVSLPEGAEIPPAVSRITGIVEEDLLGAPTPLEAWTQLCGDLHALEGAHGPPLLVIHYARFEKPFLADLQEQSAEQPLDLDRIICTHEISRRLLPELPRRGLHALAGFFGMHLPAQKRAADHIRGSALIWRESTRLLASERQVQTESTLWHWLSDEKPRRTKKKLFRLPREQRLALPTGPGIYRMLGRDGQVLYVGKANSLRQRVNSHFTSLKSAPEKNLELYTQVFKVEVEPKDSACQAALSEVAAIQSQRPPYNRSLLPESKQVYYASTDLLSISEGKDEDHKLGPLTDQHNLLAIGQLGLALGGACLHSEDLFNLPEELQPDEPVLNRALELFLERHGQALNPARPAASLLRLGAHLHRLALLEQETGPQEEDPPPPDPENTGEDEEQDEQWNPENLAHALEGILRHGIRSVRRGLFLGRLGSSCLIWDSTSGQRHRLLVSENQIQEVWDQDIQRGIPHWPPQYLSLPRTRPRAIADRATHDILRVLCTELRRLCSRQGQVLLRLGNKTILDRQRLSKALERF